MRLPKFARVSTPPAVTVFMWHATEGGLLFGSTPFDASRIGQALPSFEVESLLEQLVLDDFAEPDEGGTLVGWERLYDLLESKVYASSLAHLKLPVSIELAPQLASRGTLTDSQFAIAITGWLDAARTSVPIEKLAGGLVSVGGAIRLLPRPVWRLLDALNTFASRPTEEQVAKANRRHWGRIRRLAVEAEAGLDNFLVGSVVVTPETLDIEFRRTVKSGTTVVEIVPGFDGAPAKWLELFDTHATVPEHFNISTAQGLMHVELSEPVRSVLREIKRLPGRTAAGARAEAFLINPVAALGPAAAEVIDLAQFEAARARAGIRFDRFRPVTRRANDGRVEGIGIVITTAEGAETEHMFAGEAGARAFADRLRDRLDRGLQLLAFEGHDIELDGAAREHLATIETALQVSSPVLIAAAQVQNLSNYYARVVGIGDVERAPQGYPPPKPKEEDWFPPVWSTSYTIHSADGSVQLSLTSETVGKFESKLAEAKAMGADIVSLPGFPPLKVRDLANLLDDIKGGTVEPFAKAVADPAPESPPANKTLIIKSNIADVDYVESRNDRLSSQIAEMRRPASLKTGIQLRKHQVEGVARLQQLFAASPDHCRGVLLADDMGLGKTLQILTFLAAEFEARPDIPPALVIAPVSLLMNWQQEIEQFFHLGTLDTLVAYGDALASLRVPRSRDRRSADPRRYRSLSEARLARPRQARACDLRDPA